ncbi:MAG TPA: peptide-methionine (S)-S-oxide reductase MsrA [Gemmatimonadota bacterium]|nr:peptide-methionine (S)-S-oxide reductase MsrA [Gemmatimonadota bacterium]
MDTRQATFAAGCFWGVEEAFRRVPGVVEAESGYTGGATENPSYKDVCSGGTGHAEAVRVEYDPERVSYEELLEKFWEIHDPTQRNRQGPDVGSQYRSAIFAHDEAQAAAAREAIARLDSEAKLPRPIATEVAPAGPFWRAEDYHQRYLEKRGAAHC